MNTAASGYVQRYNGEKGEMEWVPHEVAFPEATETVIQHELYGMASISTYVRGALFGLLIGILIGMAVMWTIAEWTENSNPPPQIERYQTA